VLSVQLCYPTTDGVHDDSHQGINDQQYISRTVEELTDPVCLSREGDARPVNGPSTMEHHCYCLRTVGVISPWSIDATCNSPSRQAAGSH
jgi:hypothetical protein